MSEPTLREKLLDLESRESKLDQRTSDFMENIMYRKLNVPMKISFSISLVMGVCFCVGFTYVGLTAPDELPPIFKLGFYVAGAFGLAWAVFSGYVLKKGRAHLLKTDDIIQGLSFGFIVILMVVLLLASGYMKDDLTAVKMVLNGMVFLILFGIPAMLHMRMRQTERMLMDRLLQIELKLTEMQEEKER